MQDLINVVVAWYTLNYNLLVGLHVEKTLLPFVGQRLLFTYCPESGQFRVWHGFPCNLDDRHADSCGEGILKECLVRPDQLPALFQGISNKYEFFRLRADRPDITTPSGGRLWGMKLH